MGSLRDKYLKKYVNNEEEDEKKSSSPNQKTEEVKGDTSSVRTNMLEKYVGSGKKDDINSDSISTFFLDAEDYLSNSKSRYSNLGYGNASDAWDKNRRESSNLLARGYSIREYLSKNKDSIDEKSYKSMIKQLDSIDDAVRGYTGAFSDARKYYSQWESEEEYLKWKKDTEEYEALKNFDTKKGESEVQHLEKVLNEYKTLSRTMIDEQMQERLDYITANYGDEKGIKSLISEKKQYLNRAKHIQEGITLAGVINNDDFKENSGYTSTKSDDRWSKLTSDFGMGYDDLTYEYINGEESGMRQEIIDKALAYDADTDKFFVYDHMTDDQIATYNYYYAKDGKEAAEKYLDSIQESLNYQAATERYEKMEGKTALELLFGIEAGVDQFQSGMKNLFNTEDDYIAQTATQMASGMVRDDLADNGVKLPDWLGGASLAQAGYDAITTTANMVPSIMTSTVMNIVAPGSGAVVGSAMMGMSAAGNAYQEMLNLGYDKDQARVYSTLVGASEAGLQYLLGGIGSLGGKVSGNVLTKMMSGVDNAFLRTALKVGGNMLSEGFEEGLQEILTPWLQNLVMHTGENVNWSEVAYSTLLGALTAGVMEGPTTIGDAVSIRNTGKQLQAADISATRLAEIGKTFSADTVAYQLAGKVDENTGAYTMGRLFNEIGASLSEQNVTEITEALVAKGMDKTTAQKNAEVLAYVVEGGQLSDANIAKIEANEVLAEVARTTLIDANTTWNQRSKGYNEALMALAQEKASRTNPAKQSQEKAPVADTMDTQNNEAVQSLSEAETVDTSPANVKSISSIENGRVTVKLADGTEVNVKEADLSVDDGVRIETISQLENISPADANFILNTLRTNTGTSAQMDSLGAREAYKYGFYGFAQEHMTVHGVFANSLTETQRTAIYETGRAARQKQVDAKQAVAQKAATKNASGKVHFEGDHSKLTERQSASLTAMEKVAEVLGVQIYVFESKLNERGKRVGANGWYDPKDSSIHIDLHAGENGAGTMLFTLAHELTHHIRQWSPAKFKVLADFLMQEYGKKGVNVDALVREQMAKAKRNRPDYNMTYDEAYEEVVADSMEIMLSDGNVMKRLEKLKAQDKDLWHKIKSFIDELAAKIRAAYKGMAPDSVEGRHVADMGEAIYRLQELFAEGLADASENFQSAMETVVEADAKAVSEEEIITDGAVVTDGQGKKYSLRSMKQDIAEGQMFEDLKTYCGWTQKQVDELRNNLADLVEYMTPYRDILDMNETYGREGRRFSPYKPNSDPLYKISMDFSTLCSKRLLTQYVIENLQLRENRPMSAEEQMAIRDMLNEYRKVEKGLQVACAMCYVEAARLKSPKQITKWMEDPGTQMKNYFADKNPEFANFIKEKQADFKESRGYDRNATKKDMSPKDVRDLNKIRPRLRSQYQLSPEEAKIIERAESLPGSTYLTAGNLASLSETDPTIYAAYTAFVRTATRSKSLETDEPYYYGDSRRDNGNGIIVSDSFIEAVNRENGMRFSSWSDWRIQHLLDYITAVIDNSVRGAAMHGYTKFGDEVRVLGKTGMMFNMSGVAGTQTGLNEDGSLSFSPTESIDVNEAIQLREEFPDTAGLQCIGVGDDHIIALLRSDIIDYVIPYHVSGLNAGLRAMANIHGWKDYTSTQHAAIDKSIKLENAVDKEHWHEEPVYSEFFVGYDTGMTGIEAMRASADRYVQMCKDRGLKPKFEQFVNEDNYWKLLIDRKMVNQKTGKLIKQKPVTPTFDFDTVKSVVDQFVENYDSGLEARALNHIVENWDSIPKRIRDLKKQGSSKAKKASKAVDTLANQTLAAQPAEIKRSDRDNAPTFYSHMAKVVDGVKQEKLGAASVVSMLRGKGVKAEEIKWSGIEEWLAGKKSVTKAELQEFIAGSVLQIEEETLDYTERPYTEDQKKRLTEYEAKRDDVVKRLVNEWKRITGEEFPVQNPGYDLESTVARKIIEANLEYKKATFEGRLIEKLRKDFQKVSEDNDDFGFDSWRDALRSLHRHRKDFIKHYELSSNEKAVIVKYCNALNAYNELQNKISEEDSDRLRDIAREAAPWNRKIMEVKHEYNEEAAKHMPKWDGRRYNLEGGRNYREVLFRIPDSTYTNDAMFTHWENRSGILAHARIQDFNTFIGKMLFVEELQSDWHNEGHKTGYKDVPDAPFRDNYHEFVLKRLIRMAAEQDYDSIGWTTADIQSGRWSKEYAEGYRIEYDQDIPKFLNKYGKKWGTRVGKTVLDNGTEVWSMAITDSMKDSVLAEGQPLYSDRDVESVSNRSLLANAFEGVAQNDIERQKIQEYKGKISLIESEERKLQKLNEQIKDLSFAKGPRDTKAIRDLQFQAKQTANRISTYDKQLLALEASKPLQNVLQREKKMAYQRAEKKGKDALAAYREKTMKTQRELIEKWQESRKKGVENREKTAMRHKIKNVVGELNNLLLTDDKKRHVPDNLKKAVADALDLVNMDTVGAEERAAKYAALIAKETDPDKIDAYTATMENILRQGEKMGKRLKELHEAYEEIQNSDDPDIANAYDPVIAGAIKELSQTIGKTSLRNMTLDQLSDVYDVYRMVLTRVRDANKTLLDNIKESISNLASRTIGEVRMAGGEHKTRATILDPVKKFMWNNMKPVYAMEYIGSSTLTKVFNNVRSGEDVWAKDVTEAREYYLDKAKKYGYNSWDFKKKYRFQSASDLEFELTLEQILSLYAYSKREQAHDHLRLGGFVFDSNIETYKDKGSKLIKYKVNTADAHQISPEILANIIGTLASDQMGFVDEMQEYLSAVMGAKGNEVTSKMYGVKLFKEKFYFPLKSAKQFMFEQNEVSGEVKIKNSGFTNKVVAKANNPVILSNFMEVWSGHVNDMSMYHAFTLPLEDFNRVFNYNSPKKENQPSVSVKGTIQNAYSPAAVHYVKQLITDLNGGARSDSTTGFINKMMGLFKKGSVFASLSVVIQQPSAIARAAALVDTKYFIGPKVDHKRHKALWDEVKQYAPVAIIKEMGYFDTNMGKSTQDFILGKEYSGFKDKMKALVTDSGYRDEALSKAPALADEIAWCSIWEAVKRETKAKYPGLDTKAEPFLKLCGSRFTEVIVKTQVYDSVLSRSGLMRSKDTGMKMATAFMAEPTTSINMITDALLKGKRGNRKYARGAIGAVIASQILNSILVSFVYAGRDDDEDETYWEKYIGTLSGQALDSLNPAGYIPFIKDMISIFKGYDVERSDMAIISDLWKAIENLKKDTVSPYRKVEGFAGSIGQIFGLPVKNIMRDARGIYQTVMSFVEGQQTTKAGIGNAIKGAITGKTASNDQQLYEAIMSGDQAQISRVKGRYKDQSSINSAIRKALRANDPRIREAAIAWNANDLDEYMRIAKQIIAEKHFVQDDVVMAIRAEANALVPDDGTSSTSKAKGLFTAEKFAEAIAQGDQATANAIKIDLIQTAQKNGKTEEEAEESFANSAKGDLKELYLAGALSEAKAIQALTSYCGETQSEAEQRVAEWDFEDQHGFSYDEKKQQFMEGNISASEMKNILMQVDGKTDEEANSSIISYTRDAYEDGFFDRSKAADVMVTYGGLTEEEADSKLRYIDIKKQLPDTYVDDAWVEEYYKEVESSGISIEVFVDYRNQVKSITGEGKKERRMAVINSMPISNAQKDALYFAEGWAASKLYEAPWR